MYSKNKILIILWVHLFAFSYSQQSENLKHKITIPTYSFEDPNPLPAFVYNPKIYPYYKFEGYQFEMENKIHDVIRLENEYLTVEVLPGVGGKVWGAVDKSNGNEFIYKNEVLKFRNIAMRGPWVSGGIEFNFGIIGHHPGTASPVDYHIEVLPDGTQVCTVGTIDLPSRTQWRVRIELPKNSSAFTTKTTWYNPTPNVQSYYNWMTAAAAAQNDLVFYTPGDQYLKHSGKAESWPMDRLNRNLSHYAENNFETSKSYHVVGEYNDFFGGYYHNTDVGFGHWSRYDEIPGQKLWIWDLSRFGGIWEDLLTDTDGQYIEYQAGRLFVQYFPEEENPISQAFFEPHRTDQWTEVWFPIKDTKGLNEASNLGAMNVIVKENEIELNINPFVSVRGTVLITQNDKIEEINASFLANENTKLTLEGFTSEMPLSVVIKELNLKFNSSPKSIKRPFSTPETLKNLTTVASLFQKALNEKNYRNYSEAEDYLEAVLKLDPAHLEAYQHLAELNYEKGLFEEALTLALKGLSIDTYHHGLNFIAGINHIALSDWDNALESLGWAAHSLAYRSAAYTHMAQVTLAQKEFDEAAHYAALALNFNSSNILALCYDYLANKSLGNNDVAIKSLDQLNRIDPLHHLISFEAFLSGDLSKESLLMRHQSELPYQTFLELALLYYHAGFISEATAVLENSPQNTLIQLWHAYVTKNSKALEKIKSLEVDFIFPFRVESIAMLEWAAEQQSNWKINYLLALNYLGTHQKEKGIEILTALENRPDWDQFYWIRANILDNSNLNSTFNDYKKAYETTPKNWRFALSYSKALDKKGETKNAISVLEKAYKESPENYSIGMQLTESWVKINQFEKAIQLLNNLTVLPFEHDTGARTIYTKAYIGAALNALINRQWDGAAALLSTSLEWPERLGVGKPFDAEERINNFLLAFVREMKNEDSNEYYTNVIDYSKKHIAKGGVNCILGLYAIEMKEGKEAAKIYAQQLEGSVPNSEIEKVLSFYNNNPIQKLDVTFLKQLVEFILN